MPRPAAGPAHLPATTGRRARQRTVLGVWAHPDDETFLSAGLMLEHLARGDRVVVIVATSGEHGTTDPGRWPPQRLAARRRRELGRSLRRLGVHEHEVLGLEDGTCAEHDLTDVVAARLEALRPDITITFGPDGLTGHPDHRAVSRWTTDAFVATGRPGELWYSTVTDAFHERWSEVNERVGFWFDQPELPSTPVADLRHSVLLTGRRLDAKVAALHAHRSQTARIVDLIGDAAFREWWAVEAFRSADVAHPTTWTADHIVASNVDELVPAS